MEILPQETKKHDQNRQRSNEKDKRILKKFARIYFRELTLAKNFARI